MRLYRADDKESIAVYIGQAQGAPNNNKRTRADFRQQRGS